MRLNKGSLAHTVLRLLAEEGAPLPPEFVREALDDSAYGPDQSVNVAIGRLYERGYVERSVGSGPTGPRYNYEVTKAGRDALAVLGDGDE